jgi:arginase
LPHNVRRIRLIIVPYDSGHYAQRMGNGPLRLLENNLEGKLRNLGFNIESATLNPNAGFASETSTTFSLLELIKNEVATSLEEKNFPLILSGNCSASAGVAAAYKSSVGVVWFDAHGDCETPDTTISGFLDGMALSMLMGKSWKNKIQSLTTSPINGSKVVLIGSRDLSPSEEGFIHANEIHLVPTDDIRSGSQILLKARENLTNANVDSIHLHLDVDVLDPQVGKANSYSVDGGLMTSEVIAAIQLFKEKIPITSAVISSYDPAYDSNGKILQAIDNIIYSILS